MARKKESGSQVYRVVFLNHGQVYEVYARHVGQGGLFGFIEVEQLLFGERSKLIVDSSEEKLKTEFDGVRRFYVPLHAVVRIDEVDKEGASRISAGGGETGQLRVLPLPIPPPGGTGQR
ncbi:MAG: DUF1820 family protein [Acidobacteriota bacterium]